MTKTQLRRRFRELKSTTVKGLDKYLEAAIKSGAFDLPSAPDNYSLPKNIMCAALREAGFQWGPIRGKRSDVMQINNIYRMTYLER